VVDFPNPVRGDVVDGSVDDQTYWGRQTIFKSSPYFLAPLALRHGMTMGELALYAKAYLKLDLDLRVIRLEGWRREMWWDETGRPYLPMEPTDCTPQTPVFFLCTGLFQSTNLSWGIGTCEPFAVLGAPWMEPDRLLQAMRGRGLPGLTWSRAHFIPRWIGEQGCWARHAGRVCHGVRLHVTDRDALRVARTQLSLFVEMFRLFPGKFHYADNDAEQKQSDGMARRSGHEQWGRRLENGEGVETLLHEWERAAGQFAELRRPYLLY
jgi:uncharacterized protein YbbC (DUF1343 family)